MRCFKINWKIDANRKLDIDDKIDYMVGKITLTKEMERFEYWCQLMKYQNMIKLLRVRRINKLVYEEFESMLYTYYITR